MIVQNSQSTSSASSAPSAQNPSSPSSPARAQTDTVSLDAGQQVQAVVQAVQASIGTDRAARIQQLEAAIREGGYQPDAGQLAEKIVQAAEVDARLSVVFGGG